VRRKNYHARTPSENISGGYVKLNDGVILKNKDPNPNKSYLFREFNDQMKLAAKNSIEQDKVPF